MTNIDDSILFVCNPGNSVMSINDGNNYIDVRGDKYHNFILNPFSSLILKKVTPEIFYSNIIQKQDIFLLVYPNPAKTTINVLTNDTGNKTITIIYISGKIVYKSNTQSDYFSVDITSFTKGLYIIIIKGDRNLISSKFIVM